MRFVPVATISAAGQITYCGRQDRELRLNKNLRARVQPEAR